MLTQLYRIIVSQRHYYWETLLSPTPDGFIYIYIIVDRINLLTQSNRCVIYSIEPIIKFIQAFIIHNNYY